MSGSYDLRDEASKDRGERLMKKYTGTDVKTIEGSKAGCIYTVCSGSLHFETLVKFLRLTKRHD